MGEAYEKRYGYKFLSFQNSVDSQGRLPFSRKNWHTNEGFKLTYIGSILPNAQLYSLSDIAKAVTQLSQQGFKIELNIYSPWAKTFENELQISASVHLYPPLDEASIFPCLTSSDLLVLPVNFDKKSLEYIRYSMPAKVPLYLISGTPILVYGPPEVASVDYATKESWGFVVSQNEQDVLMNGIKELMKSEAKREQLGRTAMSVAQKNHDSSMEKEEFCQKLAQIVKGIE
jgi:glycosyltransferase involved in cell wall biosynthesis